ncbi:MAG TPA: hypothetical protein VE982_04680 [Gaiellaceae bacterium]|nr:hypothetical protein [Gaiellaceae bacterium]
MGRGRSAGVAAVVASALLVGVAGGAARAAAGGSPHAIDRHAAVDVGTRALIVRALRSGGPTFVCTPAASWSNSASAQTCTITASKGVCIEVSTNPAVTQSCTFTQASSRDTNSAVALQVITQRELAQTDAHDQAGSQTIETQQGNAAGSNVNWSAQIVKQLLGRGADNPDDEAALEAAGQDRQQASGVPFDFTELIRSLDASEVEQENAAASSAQPTSAPVTQTQQSQQTIHVCQGAVGDPCDSAAGMSGDNVNGDYQSLRQWEWASDAPSIEQSQNATAGTCANSDSQTLNMCSVVHQNTAGGKNANGAFQAYRQFQQAANTSGGHQVQDAGADLGGLGHDVFQLSVVPSAFVPQLDSIITGQRARQVQRAENAGTLTQAQDPHVDKGPASTQTGSTHDTWHGWIDTDQTQALNGTLRTTGSQSQDLGYAGSSTGDIVAMVRGSENGSTATSRCAPGNTFDVCNAGVTCTSAAGKAPDDVGCKPTGEAPHEQGDRDKKHKKRR